MLVVVVMSLFVGGTLVVLSGVLLLCRRCWEVHQGFNRFVPINLLLSGRPGGSWGQASASDSWLVGSGCTIPVQGPRPSRWAR